MRFTQVEKIFTLSSILALGFILIILSCALFHNWYPLMVVAMFLLAPLPNGLCGARTSDDFMSDTPDLLADFGRFLTGFLLLGGVALPILFNHNAIISHAAMYMSLAGGGLVYCSIVTFGTLYYEQDAEF